MAILRPFMDLLDDPLSVERGVLARPRWGISALIWVGGFACMDWMQTTLELGLAAITVTLILTSALASLFVTPLMAVVFALGAALAFNYLFAPPIGSFQFKLGLHHDVILIVALGVSLVVGALTSRLRIVGLALQQRIGQLKTLNGVSNTLNRSEDPAEVTPFIGSALTSMVDAQVSLIIAADVSDASAEPGDPARDSKPEHWGTIDDAQLAAMRQCMSIQAPVPAGPHGICLPLTGQQSTLGAALLIWRSAGAKSRADLDAAQTLCNLFGMALERAQRARKAAAASKAAFRRQHSNLVLSAVSHEYRTPLTTILSHASQMRTHDRQLGPNEKQRMLDNIIDEVEHLKRVTGNMLQLARLDAQAFSLQLEWESIEDLLGSVLHRFRTRDPDWRATADLAPGLPLIRCDAILLAQVLDNLLDNARSYAGGQAPHIAAWTEDNMLHIAVMDRGPGIDPALQLRLFQVFERGRALKHATGLPEESSRQRMGTGVGLALCRAILKAHGGEITWKPRDGGGSVFECVLPLSSETAMTIPTSLIEEEPIS
ncbi:ATP-binding protein [Hydrogenophaga sp. RWCD_12]|uniref:ATP-binding protein n=1 Tax=Hydrogenophaga sp. RWCD_12 TaxID=3391190 RepID=UPI003984A556